MVQPSFTQTNNRKSFKKPLENPQFFWRFFEYSAGIKEIRIILAIF
jgi:hypothetical protein